MKFSAQEEYGLRCILSLARTEEAQVDTPAVSIPAVNIPGKGSPDLRCLTTHEIAEREGLSLQYTGKLIRILGRAGLIESVRGRKGGYRLARPASRISVSETLAALGGKIYEAGTCGRYKGDRSFCVHTNDCSIRSLWAGLQIMIDSVLSRTTLRDLIASEVTMGQHVKKYAALVESFAGTPAQAMTAIEPAETLGASE